MTEKQTTPWKAAAWSVGGTVLAALIIGGTTWFWNADHKLTAIDFKLEQMLGLQQEIKAIGQKLADHDKLLIEHEAELRHRREAKGVTP